MRALIYLLPLVAVVVLGGRITVGQDEELCFQNISDLCPVPDPAAPVFFPDPTNCAKFCECSNGLAYSLTCSPETLYDVTDEICKTASEVDCGDRPISVARASFKRLW
ncbi:uncharacterized protein LOC108682642 [Hyalella azteca]|uniref:Uncharacterized protein LOC108682642 n=1 Tax=Hyalella azteca TaxID=294128 RepID=A0A8B7PMB3_HYAAZ|nr:uncharacterized protein LOC108682642 [Hyalella azteca]